MGGNAFSPLLATPRMPPEHYHAAVDRCQGLLKTLFEHVATPVEGPGKEDHGDVDILVTGRQDQQDQQDQKGLQLPSKCSEYPRLQEGQVPELSCPEEIWSQISDVLGAEHTLHQPGDKSGHFAIPYDMCITPANGGPANVDSGAAETRRHIQVDVRICDSGKELAWGCFRHSHSDLWSILGSIMRPWGLTIDESALWLRIPEIEAADRKRARVFLTDDIDRILDLLGLSAGRDLARPFDSYDHLFRYAASSWMFFLSPVEPVVVSDGGGDNAVDQPKRYGYVADLENLAESSTSKVQKASDKRRLETRPLFRAWFQDFVPRSRAAGLYPPRLPFSTAAAGDMSHAQLRALFREELFASFPDARETYTQRVNAFAREGDDKTMWQEVIRQGVDKEECARIAAELSEAPPARTGPEFWSVTTKALREIMFNGSDLFGGIRPELPLRDEDGRWRFDAAREFVATRWRDVASHAWELHRVRMALKLAQKGKTAAVGVEKA